MSSIILNFYDDLSNLPFEAKTLKDLREFISYTYQVIIDDVNELDIFYHTEEKEKKVIKNNLDLSRAIFYLKNSKLAKKEIIIQVSESSSLYKVLKKEGDSIQISKADLLKNEILEKEKLLFEILEKEKQEKENYMKAKKQEELDMQEVMKKVEEERILLERKMEERRRAEEEAEILRKVEEERALLEMKLKERKQEEEKKLTKKVEKKSEKLSKSKQAELEKIVDSTADKMKEKIDSDIISVKKNVTDIIGKKLVKIENINKPVAFKCNGCEKKIKDIRYQCTICDNFHYCTDCEEKYFESHQHPFLKLRLTKKKEEKINDNEKISNEDTLLNKFSNDLKRGFNEVFNAVKDFKESFDYKEAYNDIKNNFSLEGVSDEKIMSALKKAKGDIDTALEYLFSQFN